MFKKKGLLFSKIFIMTFFLLYIYFIPRIDYVAPNPLFIHDNFTYVYYLLLIVSILFHILYEDEHMKRISEIIFIILIFFMPNVLLKNPWHMDSYAFVNEAILLKYVSKTWL